MRRLHLAFLCTLLLLMVGCAHSTRPAPSPSERSAPAAQLPPLLVRELLPGLFLHRSHKNVTGFGLVASNGLLIRGDQGGVLIDTAYSDGDSALLLDRAASEYAAPVRAAVITHAHEDRLGGLRVLNERGVMSYALGLTRTRAREAQLAVPTEEVAEEQTLQLAGLEVEVFYPGHAHAPDNIVVYLPAQRTLFGGCMVRAADQELGYLGDADLTRWSAAIERVIARFPATQVVVPGHGEPGGPELLSHTRALVLAAL